MSSSVVTVFGSAGLPEGHREYQKAMKLGRLLAEQKMTICSGGYGGIMEAVSKGACEAGGKVIAVTLRNSKSRVNSWVHREIKVATWQDRLFRLISEGDAYVVMDGGTGTLVELFVVWEMMNKFKLNKSMLVLGSFKHSLLSFLKTHPLMTWNDHIMKVKTPEEAVRRLQVRRRGNA
jgi:uncharacterized protein (TIGR00725 family)